MARAERPSRLLLLIPIFALLSPVACGDDPPNNTRYGAIAGGSGACNAANSGAVPSWNITW